MVFHSRCTNSHLTNSARGGPFLHLLTNAVISCPLDDSHSSKCERLSHCVVFICISLTTSGGEHLPVCPLAICTSPWEKCQLSEAAPYPVKGSYLCKDQITGFPMVTADTLCNPPFQASYLDSQPPLQEPGEGSEIQTEEAAWSPGRQLVKPGSNPGGLATGNTVSITNPFCLSTHGKAPYWRQKLRQKSSVGPHSNQESIPFGEKSHSGKCKAVCLTKNTLLTKAIVQLFLGKKKSVTSF